MSNIQNSEHAHQHSNQNVCMFSPPSDTALTSAAHLTSYFRRPANAVPFAWAAKCTSMLHRRRKLMTIRTKSPHLAYWTDETGSYRLQRAFQWWHWCTQVWLKFRTIATNLRHRYLLRTMHRWFDYLPIRKGALKCKRVFVQQRVCRMFNQWRAVVQSRKRALGLALLSRIRRNVMEPFRLRYTFRSWITYVRQNRAIVDHVRKRFAFHRWLKIRAQCAALRRLRRTFRQWKTVCCLQRDRNKLKTHDSESIVEDCKPTRTASVDSSDASTSRQPTEESDTASTVDDSESTAEKSKPSTQQNLQQPISAEYNVDVEKLLNAFCVNVDSELARQVQSLRSRLQSNTEPLSSDSESADEMPLPHHGNVRLPPGGWSVRQTHNRTDHKANLVSQDSLAIAKARLAVGGVPQKMPPQQRVYSPKQMWVASFDSRAPVASNTPTHLRLLHATMQKRRAQLVQDVLTLRDHSDGNKLKLLRLKFRAACYKYNSWQDLFRLVQ